MFCGQGSIFSTLTFFTLSVPIRYSGISIKWTPCKADTSIRRTVWRGTEYFALWSNYLGKNLYKVDSSIKRTLFLHQWCPFYSNSDLFSFSAFFFFWQILSSYFFQALSDFPSFDELELFSFSKIWY